MKKIILSTVFFAVLSTLETGIFVGRAEITSNACRSPLRDTLAPSRKRMILRLSPLQENMSVKALLPQTSFRLERRFGFLNFLEMRFSLSRTGCTDDIPTK